MASRRLGADEAALWARVMAGVRPLGAALPVAAAAAPAPPSTRTVRSPERFDPVGNERQRTAHGRSQNTLDGTWDRQLARGLAAPDRTVDLHGHTLASAYTLLDGALDHAIRDDARVLLLVTGKPPRQEATPPPATRHVRGAIRAAVGDWLAGSRHAAAIAAVRPAHPRHGGGGALYIVLRKRAPARKS